MKIFGLILTLFLFWGCDNKYPVISVENGEVVTGPNIIGKNWVGNNPYSLNSIYEDDTDIIFNVSYSGGCKEHLFRLYADDGMLKTMPPGLRVFLKHDSSNDFCEAWITEDIRINKEILKGKVDWLQGRDVFSLYIVSQANPDSIEVITKINM